VNDIATRFQADTANHTMTVLHDDGLYRHLRFKAPGNGFYWFDLVTWPGALSITGDVDGYTFRRMEDMFAFFRMSSSCGINPHYWQEKVVAGREGLRTYSKDLLNQQVAEELKEAEADYPGVTAAWEKAVGDTWFPDYDIEFEEGARGALDNFEFGTKYKATCSCGESKEFDEEFNATLWRHQDQPSGARHVTSVERVEGFRFYDTTDWELRDYAWEFLWCCHAVVWGIRQYDQAKARTLKARMRRAVRRLNPRRSARKAVAS